MDKYSKEEIALIQLITSIELYKDDNFIPAITLGGVAEEIFGALLKLQAKEKNSPIQTAAEIDNSLFELSKDILGIDNYLSYRNRPRNELKHHGDENNKNFIKANFKQIALTHISGGIINYRLYKKDTEQDKSILEFCQEVGISVNK